MLWVYEAPWRTATLAKVLSAKDKNNRLTSTYSVPIWVPELDGFPVDLSPLLPMLRLG